MNRLHTVHNHHKQEPHEEHDEDENFTVKPAHIFDAASFEEQIPEGFDAVRILLDGTLKAPLDWKKASAAAENYKKKGLRLFWEIDLGLFNALQYPIGNQSQFLSIALSLEHFRDTLWKTYRSETIGLCIYRGNADSSLIFPWDEEQMANLIEWSQDYFKTIQSLNEEAGLSGISFSELTPEKLSTTLQGKRLLALFCRDVIAEYLNLLADRMPDTMNCCALFDASSIKDPVLAAQLLSKEKYSSVLIGSKGPNQYSRDLSWDGPMQSLGSISRKIIHETQTPIGVCLPRVDSYNHKNYLKLSEQAFQLEKAGACLRFISSDHLTAEWDGLDVLAVDSESVDSKIRRKLLGFCAAGGTVLTIGESLHLPKEIKTLEEYVSNP